jgi:hypothetical protein
VRQMKGEMRKDRREKDAEEVFKKVRIYSTI